MNGLNAVELPDGGTALPEPENILALKTAPEDGTKSEGSFFDNREWLTTQEAAEYLGLSAASLRNMTSNGQVPYYKLGNRNRYLKSELRRLLFANRKGGSNGF